jgi:hypothetical protein
MIFGKIATCASEKNEGLNSPEHMSNLTIMKDSKKSINKMRRQYES